MANFDSPRGFWPVRHLCGNEITTLKCYVSSADEIFEGDLVSGNCSGHVEALTATDAMCVGVAAEYCAATSTVCHVYADPFIVFGVQTDDGGSTVLTQADIGHVADPLFGSGSTLSGISGQELDISSINEATAAAIQLKIVGLVDEPGNEWGDNCDVEILINQHLLHHVVQSSALNFA